MAEGLLARVSLSSSIEAHKLDLRSRFVRVFVLAEEAGLRDTGVGDSGEDASANDSSVSSPNSSSRDASSPTVSTRRLAAPMLSLLAGLTVVPFSPDVKKVRSSRSFSLCL